MNEQTAKLLQKVSERLRDAPDIFFRRRSVCSCSFTDWLKFKNPEAPALSARPKRIGDDDYPQMQDAHSATALMCGETEWSK